MCFYFILFYFTKPYFPKKSTIIRNGKHPLNISQVFPFSAFFEQLLIFSFVLAGNTDCAFTKKTNVLNNQITKGAQTIEMHFN